jgi:DNA methylase
MTFDRRASTATQLSLALDGAPAPLADPSRDVLPGGAPAPELPAIDIAPEWKEQQRLWGPALHPMCSYLASFPAALAHAFIGRYSRRGDVVFDPFSGRGTTPLQACAEGRVGVGNDLNPFAHLLTAAKVEPAGRPETADPRSPSPRKSRSRSTTGRSPSCCSSARRSTSTIARTGSWPRP